MKKILLTILVISVTKQTFSQNVQSVNASSVVLKFANSSNAYRIRDDKGNTKCGHYFDADKMFYDCLGNGTKIDDKTKLIPSKDCCSEITLNMAEFKVEGTLTSLNKNTIQVANNNVVYTIYASSESTPVLTKLSSAVNKNVAIKVSVK